MPHSHCAICEADFLYSDCVEGGRSDLARKVLELVEAKRAEYGHECDEAARIGGGDHPNLWAARARATSHMADLLQEMFQAEGVALLPQREEQGGEGRST